MTLVLDGLRCGYGDTPVVSGVSVSVRAGEVLCLLGANGVGKTTLFKSVLGLIPLLEGRVLVDGQDLDGLPAAQRARMVGYVPQASHNPFAFSVLDVVLMGRTAHIGAFGCPGARDRSIAREAMESLGIGHLSQTSFGQLSGGQRQLVMIARALAQQSQIIMLDEPTASLDLGNQARVLEQVLRLAAEGIAVIMTTHEPEHAFLLGGGVLLLRAGEVLAAGPAAEVLTEQTLGDAYDVPVRLVRGDTGSSPTMCRPVIRRQNQGPMCPPKKGIR